MFDFTRECVVCKTGLLERGGRCLKQGLDKTQMNRSCDCAVNVMVGGTDENKSNPSNQHNRTRTDP